MKIIGRVQEQADLREYYESDRPEFLALYGRRRVGKTFLIKEYFNNDFTFYATGLANAPKESQLEAFTHALRLYGAEDLDNNGDNTNTPRTWLEAFGQLRKLVERSMRPGKKVLFIDEMPWFDTPRSGFLTGLEYFWNSWASSRPDILLIVCGSASTWIINKLLKNHGGLYNRVTQRMHLQPFNLGECEKFFRESHIELSRYQILEYYMVFGGIPLYLGMIRKGLSVAQNIDRLCFGEDAPLRNEFGDMLSSLFSEPARHQLILAALATRNCGLTRDEIIKASGLSDGGSLSRALEELEQSGFLRRYQGFGKKRKDSFYQLIDFFSAFHFRFLADLPASGAGYWAQFSASALHGTWSGNTFEQVCLLHIPQIKRKLGITGVISPVYAWRSSASKPSTAATSQATANSEVDSRQRGAQIDLVIDRNDQIIDLCEIKYSIDEFAIDAALDENLRNKRSAFIRETRTRKAVHIIFVTVYGLTHNSYWNNVSSEVTAEDLFADA
jgi:hypothetical protein